MNKYYLNHIDEWKLRLFYIREVASKFDNPVLYFGGKDSIV